MIFISLSCMIFGIPIKITFFCSISTFSNCISFGMPFKFGYTFTLFLCFKFFNFMFGHKWNKNYFYIFFDLKEDVEGKELYPLVPF